MTILAVGSLALDSIETPFGAVRDALGGSAVHFAAAASLLAPVRLVGVVGDDFPRSDLQFLSDRGVDLSGVETRPGESFRWAGRYEHDLGSPQTLETRLGVFADFDPEIAPEHRSPRLLFLGNIDPRLQLKVLRQVERPELVACDTMNFWIETRREDLLALLPEIDLLVLNDGEIRQLAGEPNLLRAARWVQRMGPPRVVIKKGEHGAVLVDGEDLYFVPGFPLEDLRDPTGAGDSFAGGLLGALHDSGELRGGALRRGLMVGAAMGSFSVEDFGVTRLARLTRDEVAARVRQLREMTSTDLRLHPDQGGGV